MSAPARTQRNAIGTKWLVPLAALLAVLIVRIAGPVDTYHQAQPLTVSYTTDIIVNGNWILPRDGVEPATKPPLYNWIAVPFVRILGFESDVAHKAPSIIALALTCAVMIMVAARVAPHPDASARSHNATLSLCAITGLACVSSPAAFKLGYLARPDMLLIALLVVAWATATRIVQAKSESAQPPLGTRAVFWLSVALAMLAKGPVALIAVVYLAVLIGLCVRSQHRWRGLGWAWGMPLVLLTFGAWVAAAYAIDADHVVDRLWKYEFLGRIIGNTREAHDHPTSELLTGLLDMPVYYLARGAPWAPIAVVGLVTALRRRRELDRSSRHWLLASGVWLIALLVVFSLSAGKRADYIAPAVFVSSLPAAWMLVRLVHKRPLLVGVVLTALVVSLLTVANEREIGAPIPGFGDAAAEFIDDVRKETSQGDVPVFTWRVTGVHVPAYVGVSGDPSLAALREALRELEQAWVIAGRRPEPPIEFHEQPFLSRFNLSASPVVRMRAVESDRPEGVPLTLYRVQRNSTSETESTLPDNH